MIKIDKDVEIPNEKREGIKTLAILEVGDSFFVKKCRLTVKVWIKELIGMAKNEISNKHGININEKHREYKFIVKTENDGSRAWRVD